MQSVQLDGLADLLRSRAQALSATAAHETRHARGEVLATHRHRMPYAALVLDGAYTETSFDGPLQCRPGTLVLHPAFHAHGDRFGRLGAHAINIDLPAAFDAAGTSAWQVHDLREAREVFARCPQRLPELLACARPLEATELPDWQRALVAALPDADEDIAVLARQLGVSAEHASRALRRSHGMSPRALRGEARWRHALALRCGARSLVEVAALAGFADQSHLTRVVRAHAGSTPALLRAQIRQTQIKCVQDAATADRL